jgi:hypothetical protein
MNAFLRELIEAMTLFLLSRYPGRQAEIRVREVDRLPRRR